MLGADVRGTCAGRARDVRGTCAGRAARKRPLPPSIASQEDEQRRCCGMATWFLSVAAIAPPHLMIIIIN